MRSRKRNAAAHSLPRVSPSYRTHVAFVPLVTLTFIMWMLYRILFRFPASYAVAFDEIIGKAIFFGLPVWLYFNITRSQAIAETFSARRLQSGLLLGIAVGGMFGFMGVLASLVGHKVEVQAAPLFGSNVFWWQFFLALMTGLWESLFFFSWIFTVIREKYAKWALVNQLLLLAVLFLVFHLPNTILRSSQFPWTVVVAQLFLLFFFALGQALFFVRTRNLYALMVSHAIWGMVLFVHTR